jgi:hypothetical protein
VGFRGSVAILAQAFTLAFLCFVHSVEAWLRFPALLAFLAARP